MTGGERQREREKEKEIPGIPPMEWCWSHSGWIFLPKPNLETSSKTRLEVWFHGDSKSWQVKNQDFFHIRTWNFSWRCCRKNEEGKGFLSVILRHPGREALPGLGGSVLRLWVINYPRRQSVHPLEVIHFCFPNELQSRLSLKGLKTYHDQGWL